MYRLACPRENPWWCVRLECHPEAQAFPEWHGAELGDQRSAAARHVHLEEAQDDCVVASEPDAFAGADLAVRLAQLAQVLGEPAQRGAARNEFLYQGVERSDRHVLYPRVGTSTQPLDFQAPSSRRIRYSANHHVPPSCLTSNCWTISSPAVRRPRNTIDAERCSGS